MAERKQAAIVVLLQVRCGRNRENHTVYFYIAKKMQLVRRSAYSRSSFEKLRVSELYVLFSNS